MMRLTLMDKHSGGCHVLDVWRTEHGDISVSVFEKSGGPQFDFELDDSDLEILSIMIERARAAHPTDSGQGGSCERCNGVGLISAGEKRIGGWGCKDCGGTGKEPGHD